MQSNNVSANHRVTRTRKINWKLLADVCIIHPHNHVHYKSKTTVHNLHEQTDEIKKTVITEWELNACFSH